MYKILSRSLARSERSLANFTNIYRRVLQNQLSDHRSTTSQTKNHTDNEESASSSEANHSLRTKSNHAITAKKAYTLLKRSLIPEVKETVHIMMFSTSSTKYFYASTLSQAKESSTNMNKKYFKNQRALDLYKQALEQCMKIKFEKHRIQKRTRNVAWKPEPYRTKEKSETPVSAGTKKPVLQPEQRPKKIVRLHPKKSISVDEMKQLVKKKTMYGPRRKKFQIVYPTHTIKYDLGLQKPYQVEKSMSKKLRTLKAEVVSAKPVAKREINTVEFVPSSERQNENLSTVMIASKKRRENNLGANESDDTIKHLISKHPALKKASDTAKMSINQKYNVILLKSQAKIRLQMKPREVTAGSSEESELIEIPLKRNEASTRNKRELSEKNDIRRKLETVTNIVQHPISTNLDQTDFELTIRRPKSLLPEKNETFDIEEICLKTKESYIIYSDEITDVINNINLDKMELKAVKQEAQNEEHISERRREDKLTKSPIQTKQSAKLSSQQKPNQNSRQSAQSLIAYLKKLNELKEQSSMESSSIKKPFSDIPKKIRNVDITEESGETKREIIKQQQIRSKEKLKNAETREVDSIVDRKNDRKEEEFIKQQQIRIKEKLTNAETRGVDPIAGRKNDRKEENRISPSNDANEVDKVDKKRVMLTINPLRLSQNINSETTLKYSLEKYKPGLDINDQTKDVPQQETEVPKKNNNLKNIMNQYVVKPTTKEDIYDSHRDPVHKVLETAEDIITNETVEHSPHNEENLKLIFRIAEKRPKPNTTEHVEDIIEEISKEDSPQVKEKQEETTKDDSNPYKDKLKYLLEPANHYFERLREAGENRMKTLGVLKDQFKNQITDNISKGLKMKHMLENMPVHKEENESRVNTKNDEEEPTSTFIVDNSTKPKKINEPSSGKDSFLLLVKEPTQEDEDYDVIQIELDKESKQKGDSVGNEGQNSLPSNRLTIKQDTPPPRLPTNNNQVKLDKKESKHKGESVENDGQNTRPNNRPTIRQDRPPQRPPTKNNNDKKEKPMGKSNVILPPSRPNDSPKLSNNVFNKKEIISVHNNEKGKLDAVKSKTYSKCAKDLEDLEKIVFKHKPRKRDVLDADFVPKEFANQKLFKDWLSILNSIEELEIEYKDGSDAKLIQLAKEMDDIEKNLNMKNSPPENSQAELDSDENFKTANKYRTIEEDTILEEKNDNKDKVHPNLLQPKKSHAKMSNKGRKPDNEPVEEINKKMSEQTLKMMSKSVQTKPVDKVKENLSIYKDAVLEGNRTGKSDAKISKKSLINEEKLKMMSEQLKNKPSQKYFQPIKIIKKVSREEQKLKTVSKSAQTRTVETMKKNSSKDEDTTLERERTKEHIKKHQNLFVPKESAGKKSAREIRSVKSEEVTSVHKNDYPRIIASTKVSEPETVNKTRPLKVMNKNMKVENKTTVRYNEENKPYFHRKNINESTPSAMKTNEESDMKSSHNKLWTENAKPNMNNDKTIPPKSTHSEPKLSIKKEREEITKSKSASNTSRRVEKEKKTTVRYNEENGPNFHQKNINESTPSAMKTNEESDMKSSHNKLWTENAKPNMNNDKTIPPKSTNSEPKLSVKKERKEITKSKSASNISRRVEQYKPTINSKVMNPTTEQQNRSNTTKQTNKTTQQKNIKRVKSADSFLLPRNKNKSVEAVNDIKEKSKSEAGLLRMYLLDENEDIEKFKTETNKRLKPDKVELNKTPVEPVSKQDHKPVLDISKEKLTTGRRSPNNVPEENSECKRLVEKPKFRRKSIPVVKNQEPREKPQGKPMNIRSSNQNTNETLVTVRKKEKSKSLQESLAEYKKENPSSLKTINTSDPNKKPTNSLEEPPSDSFSDYFKKAGENRNAKAKATAPQDSSVERNKDTAKSFVESTPSKSLRVFKKNHTDLTNKRKTIENTNDKNDGVLNKSKIKEEKRMSLVKSLVVKDSVDNVALKKSNDNSVTNKEMTNKPAELDNEMKSKDKQKLIRDNKLVCSNVNSNYISGSDPPNSSMKPKSSKRREQNDNLPGNKSKTIKDDSKLKEKTDELLKSTDAKGNMPKKNSCDIILKKPDTPCQKSSPKASKAIPPKNLAEESKTRPTEDAKEKPKDKPTVPGKKNQKVILNVYSKSLKPISKKKSIETKKDANRENESSEYHATIKEILSNEPKTLLDYIIDDQLIKRKVKPEHLFKEAQLLKQKYHDERLHRVMDKYRRDIDEIDNPYNHKADPAERELQRREENREKALKAFKKKIDKIGETFTVIKPNKEPKDLKETKIDNNVSNHTDNKLKAKSQSNLLKNNTTKIKLISRTKTSKYLLENQANSMRIMKKMRSKKVNESKIMKKIGTKKTNLFKIKFKVPQKGHKKIESKKCSNKYLLENQLSAEFLLSLKSQLNKYWPTKPKKQHRKSSTSKYRLENRTPVVGGKNGKSKSSDDTIKATMSRILPMMKTIKKESEFGQMIIDTDLSSIFPDEPQWLKNKDRRDMAQIREIFHHRDKLLKFNKKLAEHMMSKQSPSDESNIPKSKSLDSNLNKFLVTDLEKETQQERYKKLFADFEKSRVDELRKTKKSDDTRGNVLGTIVLRKNIEEAVRPTAKLTMEKFLPRYPPEKRKEKNKGAMRKCCEKLCMPPRKISHAFNSQPRDDITTLTKSFNDQLTVPKKQAYKGLKISFISVRKSDKKSNSEHFLPALSSIEDGKKKSETDLDCRAKMLAFRKEFLRQLKKEFDFLNEIQNSGNFKKGCEHYDEMLKGSTESNDNKSVMKFPMIHEQPKKKECDMGNNLIMDPDHVPKNCTELLIKKLTDKDSKDNKGKESEKSDEPKIDPKRK